MAITIQQSPETYAPVYNPMWYVCSSTNTAQANFQYLFDVYITGQTFAGGASFLRQRVPADPTYGRGVFDVGRILERYLSSDIGDTIYGFQFNTNSILQYTVKCGEEYGLSSGVTQYADLTVDSARYAYNGLFDFSEFKNYTVSDYVCNAFTSNANVNVLTNMPSSGTIRTNEDAWLNVLSQTSGAVKFANITTYTDARWTTVQGNFRVINHQYFNTSSANAANRSLRFPCGYNMNSIAQGNVYGGTLPIINGSTNSWQIYFTDSAKNRITESFFFTLDTKCTSHTEYRLHFLNKLGAFGSFTFTKANQFSTDIKRTNYEKPIGQFLSSTSYTYNQSDRLDTDFYTELKDTIQLNSDWVDENTFAWLEELVTSPTIYYHDATYGHVAIKIEDKAFTRRQHLTDKIFNLQLKVSYTYKRFRQRS